MDNLTRQIVKLAYREDIGSGDITSQATVPAFRKSRAVIIAKSHGILSGSSVFKYVFQLASPRVKTVFHVKDGVRFSPGTRIASLSGSARALFKGERLALNFLGHLSGVATLTSKYVEKVKGTKVKVLDTRKTIPGLRSLQKQAVRHGGGANHRYGLYDMILIKDNHIAAAGGTEIVLEKVNNVSSKVEIEVSNLKQLEKALNYSPDIIMLDNFNTRQIAQAVKTIKSKKKSIKIEVSGGINLNNIKHKALAGVDYISIGALTHSVKATDFSMKFTV